MYKMYNYYENVKNDVENYIKENVVHIYNYCIYIDGDLFIRIPSRDAERLVISTAKNCFVPIYYTRPY